MSTIAVPRCSCSFAQQLHDLGLDGDVEGGGRLVGQQQRRVEGQGHGDHGPLPHAAGELVRVLLGPAARVGDADLGQQVDGPRLGRGSRPIFSWTRITSAIWLPTLKTGFSAVSGSWKIIEMSRPRSDRSRRSRGGQQVLAPEHDPPGREPGRRRRHQAHDRQGGDGLARAGLADDPERLARADRPAHAVDRLHHPVVGVEVDAQVLDRQQRLGVRAAVDDGQLGGAVIASRRFALMAATAASGRGRRAGRRPRRRTPAR